MPSVETLRPDVYVVEKDFVSRAVAPASSTGGFVIEAEKGPTDKAISIVDQTQFIRRFGTHIAGGHGKASLDAFFAEGGRRCYVVRAIGAAATTATIGVSNIEEAVNAITIVSANKGAWGNDVAVTTQRWSHNPVAAEDTDAVTTLLLDSVDNIQAGDACFYEDTAGNLEVVILSVNATTKTVTFSGGLDNGVASVVAATGTTLRSSTSHRLRTETSASAASGQKIITCDDTFDARLNSRVLIADATGYQSSLVTAVNGKDIHIADNLAATYAVDSVVVSCEYDLKVYEDGLLVDGETHVFLSMESTNLRDSTNIRLSGDSTESIVITATIGAAAVAGDDVFKLPLPVSKLALAGGTDAAALSADYQTATDLLDDPQDLVFFGIPASPDVAATKHGDVLAGTTRGDLLQIVDCPETDDTPDEALDFRNFELNINSSYSALYFPWVIVGDPVRGSGTIARPPNGFIQGLIAKTARTEGVWTPPANKILNSVVDLTHITKNGDHDRLHQANVNVIRAYAGEGFNVMGGRTLWARNDGKHLVNVRLLLNFIKVAMRRLMRFAIYKINQPSLWAQMTLVAEEFLTGIWANGGLFPDNDSSRAFRVKCDSETNPDYVRNQGQAVMLIGINPPLAAEFIVIELGRFDGDVSLSETTASGEGIFI